MQHTSQISIETQRLLLREYQTTDWEAVHLYAKQADILKYEVWGPNTEKETMDFVEMCIKDRKVKPRTTFEFCITLKSNQRLIGGCGFRIDKQNTHSGNFGYTMNPDYWNKGYATEAALGLLEYMVNNQGITKITATCDALNVASIRVLEKCGLYFVKEIKNDKKANGRIRDTFCFEKRSS